MNIEKEIIENFPYGVIFVDKNKKIKSINRLFEIFTNMSKDDIIGKDVGSKVFKCLDNKGRLICYSCPILSCFEEKKGKVLECFIENRGGFKIPVVIKAFPIFKEKEFIGCSVVFEDNVSKYLDLKRIKKYEQLAMIDPLTNLPNRRLLEAMFDKFLYKVKRFSDYSFAVIFIDIDDFKKINDLYGHDEGDRVLINLARIMEDSLRQYDIASRYGGEEFILLLQYISDKENLFQIADRLREKISRKIILANGKNVTVSMGGTIVYEYDDKDNIIKKVDRLMYKSKKSGKNRVTVE